MRLALLCTLVLSACADVRPHAAPELVHGKGPAPAWAIEVEGPAHVVPGTLVVEDDVGVRTPAKTGAIQFWLTGWGGELLEAGVSEGEFALELPRKGGELDVGPITIDGELYWALGPWAMGTMPERADLVARRVKPAFVQCVDAETGAPLSSGRVRRASRNVWIGDSFEKALPLAFPFEVPLFAGRDDDVVRGWIGLRGYEISPTGYARRRMSIDPSEGGTRTFEFEKAATLRVRLWLDHDDDRKYGVTLIDAETHESWQSQPFGPATRDPDAPDAWLRTLTIDDQPPGACVLMTSAFGPEGSSEYEPVPLRVRAGEVMDVDLRRSIPSALPDEFELRGTLRVPDGLDPTQITLWFRPYRWESGAGNRDLAPIDVSGERFVIDRRDPGLAHWFAGSVRPGRWIASVPALGWSQEFELVSDAGVALELTLPPTSDRRAVRFRVLDGRTGRALNHSDITVRVDGDANNPSCDGATSTWKASAPPGSVRVVVRSHDSRLPDTEVEFMPDAEITVLTLWRDLEVEVRAYDGAARIGAAELYDLAPRIESIEHAGRAYFPSATVFRENRFTDHVTHPGRYRITLPPNDRYAPHVPVEVEVKPDEPTPVAIFRLTRRAR